MTYKSIQPSTKTELEQRFGESQIYPVAHPIRDLWNVWSCPAHLLPYLAWSLSVDYWHDDWSEQRKRQAIENSFVIHKHKGTVGAVWAALKPFGYEIRIREWHQTTPEGVPGTFFVNMITEKKGLAHEDYQEIKRLIEITKPVSRVLSGLIFTIYSRTHFNVRCASVLGGSITVYPRNTTELSVNQAHFAIATTHPIHQITIKPKV